MLRRKRSLFVAAVAVAAAISMVILFREDLRPYLPVAEPPTAVVAGARVHFGSATRVPYLVSTVPAHGDVVPGVPIGIVVNLDRDILVPGTTLAVVKDGKDYGYYPTRVDEDHRTMRRSLDPAAPDGAYAVRYRVCFKNSRCHEGSFTFAIDRSLADAFEDDRNRENVVVTIKNNALDRPLIRVTRGTRIIWRNDDSQDRSILSDPPGRATYFPNMNSKPLAQTKSYGFEFDIPGYYPYRIGSEARSARGTLVVE